MFLSSFSDGIKYTFFFLLLLSEINFVNLILHFNSLLFFIKRFLYIEYIEFWIKTFLYLRLLQKIFC